MFHSLILGEWEEAQQVIDLTEAGPVIDSLVPQGWSPQRIHNQILARESRPFLKIDLPLCVETWSAP